MSVYWPIAKAFDLIVVAGQSNANGAGTPRDPDIDVSGGAYQWGQLPPNGQQIIDAPEALEHIDNNVTGTRMGFAVKFARDYYIPNRLAAGRKVMLVPVAHGGYGFENNHWNPGDDQFVSAVQRTNAAMRSRMPGNNRVVMILWAQGEREVMAGTGWTGAQYKAAQEACLAGLRAQIDGGANVPIILTNIRPEWAVTQSNGMEIFDAIADTPNRVANCAYVDPTGLAGNNALEEFHYNAASARILATRFWTAYSTLVPT